MWALGTHTPGMHLPSLHLSVTLAQAEASGEDRHKCFVIYQMLSRYVGFEG